MTAVRCWLLVIIVIGSNAFYPADASTAEDILIGATVSLEGRFQAPSKMMRLAYRLWEKEINQAGGILGRPVRLILYNDKSDKFLVRDLYEKMIVEDNVDLVLAPYGTTLTFAAASITEQYGYVLIASAASGEILWNSNFKYVFGVYGVANRYFIGFVDMAARNGLTSVVILSEDSLFTRDAADGARKWAERMGLEVKLQQVYGDGPGALPWIVTQIEELKPDAVILCSYPPDGYRFLASLSVSSYKPRALAMSITPGLPDFNIRAGSMAEGVFGPSHWEPDQRIPFPGTQRFIQEFTLYSGINPSYHAAAAYTGCQLLTESLNAVGDIDQTKIRDYIMALDTMTVMGRFKVDSQGRQVGHNPLIIQWQKDRKEIVYPNKLKTRQARFGSP